MEAERLYALALALIPDEDVAGDLMMASRSEADLRRRSASWRASRGLPEAPVDIRPVALTAVQAQHAAHLDRRRLLRRRALRAAGLAVGAIAVMLSAYLGLHLREMLKPPPSVWSPWAGAPALSTTPLGRSEPVGGYQLEVYRVEATPDTVTAYWVVTGPGAATAAEGIDPTLSPDAPQQGLVYASHVETRPSDRNRLVGQSVFHVLAPSLTSASLRVNQVAGIPVHWDVRVNVDRGKAEPQTRTASLTDRVAEVGSSRLEVTAISVGRSYTSIRYRVTGSLALGTSRQRIGLKAGARWVAWRNTWSTTPEGGGAEEEAIFDALPETADQVTVHISLSGFHTSVVSVDQGGSIPEGIARLGPWLRDGPTLEAPLQVLDAHAIMSNAGYLLDSANRRFAVIIRSDLQGNQFVRGWESHAGFEPVALVTEVTRYSPGAELVIAVPE